MGHFIRCKDPNELCILNSGHLYGGNGEYRIFLN